MKVISKSDLMLIIPHISNRKTLSKDDFETILRMFGDEYFCVDGELQKTTSSQKMKTVREWHEQKRDYSIKI